MTNCIRIIKSIFGFNNADQVVALELAIVDRSRLRNAASLYIRNAKIFASVSETTSLPYAVLRTHLASSTGFSVCPWNCDRANGLNPISPVVLEFAGIGVPRVA